MRYEAGDRVEAQDYKGNWLVLHACANSSLLSPGTLWASWRVLDADLVICLKSSVLLPSDMATSPLDGKLLEVNFISRQSSFNPCIQFDQAHLHSSTS
jgi:hypothetical protein